MKHIPNKIYLQVGNECPDDANFNDLSEVSWCKDKVFESDIAYINEYKVYKALKDITKYIEDSIYREVSPRVIEEIFTELFK